MKKLILPFFLLASLMAASQGLPLKECATDEEFFNSLKEHPEYIIARKELEDFTRSYNPAAKAGQLYVIPIVFHVIHNYGAENISDEQVRDGVRVMNDIYRKRNADTANVISAFKSIIADCEIEFRLATKDPNGNCHNGIDRIVSNETYVGDDGSKLNPWPRDMYLNVWVVSNLYNGAAGYSNYPGSAGASTDGIIMLHNYVGSIGTSGYSQSKTLPHEAAHWLNIYHVWGSNNNAGKPENCNDDDGVNDTPNTIGHNSCDVNTGTCGSVIDNVQNYMEYSGCRYMFTNGQKQRMHAALNSSTAGRNNLWIPSNLTATGTANGIVAPLCAPVADFAANKTTVCAGVPVTFFDLSWKGKPGSWAWTFTGGNPAASSDSMPQVIYNSPGSYPVTLVSSNSTGNSTPVTKTTFVTVRPSVAKFQATGYSDGFENDSSFAVNWDIINASGLGWERTVTAGYKSPSSVRINNLANAVNSIEELVTSGIDFSGVSSGSLINLKFMLAYAPKTSGSKELLKVYYSTNCGETWIQRKSISGTALPTAPAQSPAFTPKDSTQWKEHFVPISMLTGQSNVLFKFSFVNGDSLQKKGNNIYVDNVLVDIVTEIKEDTKPLNNFIITPVPAKNSATASFNLLFNDQVQLSIIDLLGHKETIHEAALNAGQHLVSIDLRNKSGIYFIELLSIKTQQATYLKLIAE